MSSCFCAGAAHALLEVFHTLSDWVVRMDSTSGDTCIHEAVCDTRGSYEKILHYKLSMPCLLQAQARRAGSQLYRLGAVMVELSRAASALVAALDGNPAPLALNASQYIRPDGM